MSKVLSGVLMAAVLSMGLPLTASAGERDRGHRHHRPHCHLVKKTVWKHGIPRIVYKKVCVDRHDH